MQTFLEAIIPLFHIWFLSRAAQQQSHSPPETDVNSLLTKFCKVVIKFLSGFNFIIFILLNIQQSFTNYLHECITPPFRRHSAAHCAFPTDIVCCPTAAAYFLLLKTSLITCEPICTAWVGTLSGIVHLQLQFIPPITPNASAFLS